MPKKKRTPEAKFVEALWEILSLDQLSRVMYALVQLKTNEKLKEMANSREKE